MPHIVRGRQDSQSVCERSKRADTAVNGQPHQGGCLAAALVAIAGVFVATLLVGSTAVAYAPPSGRVAHVATNTAGPAIKVGLEPVGIAQPSRRTARPSTWPTRCLAPLAPSTHDLRRDWPATRGPQGSRRSEVPPGPCTD